MGGVGRLPGCRPGVGPSLPHVRAVSPTILSTLIAGLFLILGGLLRVARQVGRIEEAIHGLCRRVDHLERRLDRHG